MEFPEDANNKAPEGCRNHSGAFIAHFDHKKNAINSVLRTKKGGRP